MKNQFFKNRINYMKNSTQEVLDELIADAILEIQARKRIKEDIMERIVLVYLSFFSDNNYMEYEELCSYEKNIFCRIISKGIASIYVDDEYIYEEIREDKSHIIHELMIFLSFLTNLNYSTIKRLTLRDIKIYARIGWNWDFL